MAHNIKPRDIQVGTKVAWHQNTHVEDTITADNCRIRYGMSIEPTFFQNVNGDYVMANGRQIVSLDDNLPVGRPVGTDYKIIDNRQIWDSVAEGLGGTKHKIVSCGTVQNRSLGFISVEICDSFKAANRMVETVMNIIWGHGGNHSVIARTGFTVIVCHNTLNRAMSEHTDFKLSVRHTRNANVMDLGRAIDAHIGVNAEFRQAMDSLHEQSCSQDTARKIYVGFVTKGVEPKTNVGTTRMQNTVDSLMNLFNTGKGNSGSTLADVYNGATDYYTHCNSKKDRWSQFVKSEFGTGNARKSDLYDIMNSSDKLKETVKRGAHVMESVTA